MTAPKPVILCILDGWGLNPDTSANAPFLAKTPTFDRLMDSCPNATLVTHGKDVGLPDGQMGNSEVGHMNIGAGRIVRMDLGQIDHAIAQGEFEKNEALQNFIQALKDSGGTAHLMGVVSDGGVHGHIRHLIRASEIIAAAGVPVVVHAITDGRDVAPTSGKGFVADLMKALPDGASVGSVSGRYFAMDRDNRWDREEKAYNAMVKATAGQTAKDAEAAVQAAYDRDETDEFITPTVIEGYKGAKDGDGFFCLNFRADRAREILYAIGQPGFDAFDTGTRPKWAKLLGMVDYSEQHNKFMTTVYPKKTVRNTLAEWVASKGLTQFHTAETEKYPHVTFFLNGGKEEPEKGEVRYMAASPKVATYDLQPEMSSVEVADHLVEAIHKRYDLIVVNFANPDMVGHTGSLKAAIAACEAVDRALTRVVKALEEEGGAMIVTADHGNCEMMVDPETGGPHTSHTTNPVPVILVGGPKGVKLHKGRLADLAPTLLELMQIEPPEDMTGKSLIDR